MNRAAESGLTPELIARVMKLSAEDKDRRVELVLDDTGPPDPRTDEEMVPGLCTR